MSSLRDCRPHHAMVERRRCSTAQPRVSELAAASERHPGFTNQQRCSTLKALHKRARDGYNSREERQTSMMPSISLSECRRRLARSIRQCKAPALHYTYIFPMCRDDFDKRRSLARDFTASRFTDELQTKVVSRERFFGKANEFLVDKSPSVVKLTPQSKEIQMTLVDELSEIGLRFVDRDTGVIEYHVGEALSDAYFDALRGDRSTAGPLFQKKLRAAMNDRLRPAPMKQGGK